MRTENRETLERLRDNLVTDYGDKEYCQEYQLLSNLIEMPKIGDEVWIMEDNLPKKTCVCVVQIEYERNNIGYTVRVKLKSVKHDRLYDYTKLSKTRNELAIELFGKGETR